MSVEKLISRQRSNSIIPEEFTNDKSDGGIEMAALATVYGVREYTESKIFWDTAISSPDTAVSASINIAAAVEQYNQNSNRVVAGREEATMNNNNEYGCVNASYTTAFPVTSATALNHHLNELHRPHFAHGSKLQTLSTSSQAYRSKENPSLPHIPIVSEFGDFWSETTAISYAKMGSSNTTLTAGLTTGNISFNSSAHAKKSSLQCSDLSDYPFTLFDLIESDTDPRLILWGPSNTVSSPSAEEASVGNTTDTFQHRTKLARLTGTLSQLAKTKSLTTLTSAKNQHYFPSGPSSVKTMNSNAETSLVIEAATVEKLIERLTATLDYTYMTDFFLVYRVFMTPLQLCKFLISRFKWSIAKNDEKRCVVRIRTFVVFRHWLLNYFLHDFIPRKELRVLLSDFLNEMSFHPVIQQSPRDQRIIKGLKRVLQRLKRVYYGTASSTDLKHAAAEKRPSSTTASTDTCDNTTEGRATINAAVHIIDPAKPIYEQELQKMVKQQLSARFSLKRKAHNFVKRIHVDDRHYKNSSIQYNQFPTTGKQNHNEAVAVPVVVIGNYYSASHFSKHSSTSNAAETVNKSTSTLEKGPQTATAFPAHGQQKKIPNKQRRSSSVASSIKSLIVAASNLSHKNTTSVSYSEEPYQQSEKGNDADNYAEKQWQVIQQQLEQNPYTQDKHSISQSSESNSLDSIITPGTSIGDFPVDSVETEVYEEADTNSDSSLYPKHETSHARDAVSSARHISTNNRTDIILPTKLSEKLEKVRQEQQQQYGFSSVTETEGTPMNNYTGTEKLTNLRTRSFYTAQLAIPSNVATPDIYIPTPPFAEDEDKPDPEYFGIPSNSNRYSERPLFSRKPSLRGALTTPAASLPSLEFRKDSITTPSLSKETAPSIIPRIDSSSKCLDASNKPLPIVMSDQEDESKILEQWRLSIQQSQQRNNNEYLEVFETKEHTIRENKQPIKSRIVELDLSSTRGTGLEKQQAASSAIGSSKFDTLAATTSADKLRNTIHIQPHPRKSIILAYSTTLIAQQFCLIERAILLDIGWEELVDCRWTKMPVSALSTSTDCYGGSTLFSGGIEQRPTEDGSMPAAPGIYSRVKRMKQQYERDNNVSQRGIERAINRFNAVCQWVSSEIVQTSRIEDRVKVVEKFIRLAKKSKLFCNFATLMQILLGLQSSPVSRLTKTWALVSHQDMRTLQELSIFTSPLRNWKNIRDSMTSVAEDYGESPAEIQVHLKGSSNQHDNGAQSSLKTVNDSFKSMTNGFRNRKHSSSNSSKKDKTHDAKVLSSSVTIKLPFGGCIPFLGIYLFDLVFNAELPSFLSPPITSESNENLATADINAADNVHKVEQAVFSQPLVQFRKHRITATIIKRLLIFQNLAKRYSFEPYTEDSCILYNTCLRVTALNMEAIQRLSLTIEP